MEHSNWGEVNCLLNTFTRVWSAGGQASLSLNTLDGQVRAHLTLGLGPPSHPPPGAPEARGPPQSHPHHPTAQQDQAPRHPRHRGPSARRRDVARRKVWWARRQEALAPAPPATSTSNPSHPLDLQEASTPEAQVPPSLPLSTSHTPDPEVPPTSLTPAFAYRVLDSTSNVLITTVGEGQSTTKCTAIVPDLSDPPSAISQLDGENEEDDHSAKEEKKCLQCKQQATSTYELPQSHSFQEVCSNCYLKAMLSVVSPRSPS